MADLRQTTVDAVKSRLAATDAQHCVRKQEFDAGLAGKSDVGHTHAHDHVPVTIGTCQSLSLVCAGDQILSGEVRLGTNSGLLIQSDGLKLDFGTGVNQPARGNHTHANDHVPAIADPSQTNSITVTVSSDQKVKASVRLKTSGGILVDTNGLSLDFGTSAIQVAVGNHTHALAVASVSDGFLSAADKAKLDSLSVFGPYSFNDTNSIDFTNTSGAVSAVLRTTTGLVTSSGGVGVDFTAVAAFSHAHPIATLSAAGFMSAADKVKLDGITGGGSSGTNVTIGASQSLSLVCGVDQILTGEVRLGAGAGLLIQSDGLKVKFGTGATDVAAGNHTHANDHVIAIADPTQSDSIAVTVSVDQKIKASVTLATGSHLKIVTGVGGGLAADVGTLGSQVAAGNHTHQLATSLIQGFMSSADRVKLDGLPSSAEVPLTFVSSGTVTLARSTNNISASLNVGTGIKVVSTHVEVDFTVVAPISHVHDVASAVADGFMSSADKVRLDAMLDIGDLENAFVRFQVGDPGYTQVINTNLRVQTLYFGDTNAANLSVDVDNVIVVDTDLRVLGTLTLAAFRTRTLYLLNTTTGNYVPITVHGDPGEQQLRMEDIEETDPPGKLNIAYLLNETTGNYTPITVVGTGDERQIAYGAEVAP